MSNPQTRDVEKGDSNEDVKVTINNQMDDGAPETVASIAKRLFFPSPKETRKQSLSEPNPNESSTHPSILRNSRSPKTGRRAAGGVKFTERVDEVFPLRNSTSNQSLNLSTNDKSNDDLEISIVPPGSNNSSETDEEIEVANSKLMVPTLSMRRDSFEINESRLSQYSQHKVNSISSKSDCDRISVENSETESSDIAKSDNNSPGPIYMEEERDHVPSSLTNTKGSFLNLKRGSIQSYSGPDKYGKVEDEEDEPKAPSILKKIRRLSMASIKSNRTDAKILLFDVESPPPVPPMPAAVSPEKERLIPLQAKEEEDISQLAIGDSKSTVSIGRSKYPHAQEVSETFGSILLEMKGIFLAVLLNTGLVLLGWKMSDKLLVPLSPAVVTVACGVIVEIIVLITNELTIRALDFGAAIFLSMLMTNKSGYGMSACGYMQAVPIKRHKYAQSLSLNSPCRKMLERASFMWILLEATKILAPIAATGVISSTVRSLADTVSCIEFNADPAHIIDRTYPTLESSAGVAEFLFGNALGCMRSERNDCSPDGSQLVFGPQLQGTVGTGDTIVGSGFVMTIDTTCECMDVNSPAIVSQGVMTLKDQTLLLNNTKSSIPFLMMMSTLNISSSSVLSYSTVGNVQFCGGFSPTVLPLCLTNISNFQDAMVSASFSTDGTTASIALVDSEIQQLLASSSMSSSVVSIALNSIWPTGTPYPLVTNVPGLLNALIYWTSADLKGLDPTLYPPGIETLFAIVLRAGFQRALDSKGQSCTRLISRNDQTFVGLNFQGTVAIYMVGWIQLILSLFSLVLASVWIFSPVPLGPVIRIVMKPMYFISLLCESPFWVNLQGTANAQGHVAWQQLDIITRIGESLDTIDEPIGRIKLERPKMVKALRNGKIYA